MGVKIPRPDKMLAIATLNDKGGSDKSATAINLSHGFTQAGWNVLLVDCDDNRSVIKWKERAEKNPRYQPGFDIATLMSCHKFTKGKDLIIFDTAAQLSRENKVEICNEIDLAIIPTKSNIDSLGPTLETATTVDDLVDYRILLSSCPSRSPEVPKFREQLLEDGYKLLDAQIRQSIGVPRASAQGMPVDMMSSHYRLAWLDFKALVQEVAEILIGK